MLRKKSLYAFVAGEVSPKFHGRTDLTKYDLGVKEATNFFVDFRGPLCSRAGFEFVCPVEDSDKPTKLVRFRATTSDYFLLFGENYMRPIRDGGYLLHTPVNITASSADTITAPGHGCTTDDIVYLDSVAGATWLNKRYLAVIEVAGDVLTLAEVSGVALAHSGLAAYTSGGTVARTVRITSPYTAAQLADLDFQQRLTKIRITGLEVFPTDLTYTSDTSWAFAEIAIGSEYTGPANIVLTPSSAGTAGVVVGVTAVIDGKETTIAERALSQVIVNYTATAGSLEIEWDSVPRAQYYNVYRSLVLATGTTVTLAQELGYIGRAYGPRFVDNNIIPDFTKTAPTYENPFADQAIEYIEVTAPGSGYLKTSTVSIADPDGTGFEGYPVVNNAGELLSIIVTNGGRGYTAPVPFITDGTGATTTVERTPAAGNYPATYKIFQQRGLYAGTTNVPLGIYASKPFELENHDISPVTNAGDAYFYQLDADDVQPILHLLALRSGLLVFTRNTITLLRAEEGIAVSGVNALAEPQAYKGASHVAPLPIGLDVVFVQSKTSYVNSMLYTEYNNTFELEDISILSEHLLGEGKQITRMVWVAEPFKMLYAVREDGVLLMLSYERSQGVYGWAKAETQGFFRDVCEGETGDEDVLYAVVERKLRGVYSKTVEKLAKRGGWNAEEHFCVDCGVSTTLTYPAATITPDADTDTITASVSVFTSGSVGDILRFGGAKAEILTYVSGTEVTVEYIQEVAEVVPQTLSRERPFVEGTWSVSTPSDTFSNLWHLEGERVSVLADGDAYTDVLVTNGTITLPQAASYVHAGLQYKARAQTLPLSITQLQIDGQRKDVMGVALRLEETRGLAVGADFDNLVEIKDKGLEDWGDEIPLRSESRYIPVNTAWSEDGEICFEQAYPLPACLLGAVFDLDVGDE